MRESQTKGWANRIEQAIGKKDAGEIMTIVAQKSGNPDVGECWEWFEPRAVPRKYYAYIQFSSGRQIRIHRIVAWALAGFIAELAQFPNVHHECANRNCGNPHHLKPLSPRDNRLEGAARRGLREHRRALQNEHWVNERGENMATPSGKPFTPTQLKDRELAFQMLHVRKGENLTIAEVCEVFGVTLAKGERLIRKYFPDERVQPRGRVSEAIATRDLDELDRVLTENSELDSQFPGCRIWTGSTKSGYASLGRDPQNVYMHRVAVWISRGAPTVLELMPEVCKKESLCGFLLCVEPEHWELVTDYLGTVSIKVLYPLLGEIKALAAARSTMDGPDLHGLSRWWTYLPAYLQIELR